jgi:hypothetical protein
MVLVVASARGYFYAPLGDTADDINWLTAHFAVLDVALIGNAMVNQHADGFTAIRTIEESFTELHCLGSSPGNW